MFVLIVRFMLLLLQMGAATCFVWAATRLDSMVNNKLN